MENLIYIARRAIAADLSGNHVRATELYAVVVEILLNNYAKGDENRIVGVVRLRYDEYKIRARHIWINIKHNVDKALPIEMRRLKSGTVNCGYGKVFADFLSADVREIIIEEPKLQTEMDFNHIMHFIETLIVKCPQLEYISLRTQKSVRHTRQDDSLKEICQKLENFNISLGCTYLTEIKRSEIIFSTGYIVHSSHGLHIYDDDNLVIGTLGSFDCNMRKTKDTDIEIYFSRDLTKPMLY